MICSLKKSYCEGRQQTKYKKTSEAKTWSEKATDTLIKCFQSRKCKWNVTSGVYKEQNRKSLPLKESDMSVQECNINRYDDKKWNNLRGQFLLFS